MRNLGKNKTIIEIIYMNGILDAYPIISELLIHFICMHEVVHVFMNYKKQCT